MATHMWMSGHLIRPGSAVSCHGSSASAHSVWRAHRIRGCVLLSLAPLALVTACAKSPLAPSASSLTTAVTASAGPTTHISDPDEKTFVLLAELHSYDDPNETTCSAL